MSFLRSPVLLAASLLCLARPAVACPAAPPGLGQTVPASGGQLPANSAILFGGSSLSFDKLQVTISGMPDLAIVLRSGHDKYPALFPDNAAGFMAPSYYFLDPAPPAGQMVTIAGNFCQGSPATDACQTPVSFTTTAPDTTAPEAATVFFDRQLYTKVDGSTCSVASDRTSWLHLRSAPATAGESTVFYLIEEFSDSQLSHLIYSGLTIPQSEEITLLFPLLTSALSVPTADPCFRITTFDAAGNKAPGITVTCTPCHARTEPPPPAGTNPTFPAEPVWTDAEIIPGGACDPSQVGTGGTGGTGGAGGAVGGAGGGVSSGDAGAALGGMSGIAGLGGGGPALSPVDPDSSSGCGCHAAGRAPAGWWGLGGAAVLLAAQRRRRLVRS
jgi:MYXO-CTERM domain-containing protein